MSTNFLRISYTKFYCISFSRFRVFPCGLTQRRTDVTNLYFFTRISLYKMPSEISIFPNPRTFMRTFPLSWLLVSEIWNVTNIRTDTAKYISIYHFDLHKFITRNLSCYLQSVNTEYRNISFNIFLIPSSITSKQI